MAANLNVTNGVVSYMDANLAKNEIAWHGLGQRLQNAATAEEAMRLGGLGFNVNKAPNYHNIYNPEGEIITSVKSESSFFTYREDTNQILGTAVGKGYHVVQNSDVFSFFDSLVEQGEAIYETAGALGQGEKIFLTAKLPAHIRVNIPFKTEKDEIEQYVLLTSTHDGSGSVLAMYTPVRVVCANTLAAALRNNSNMVRIRHTKNAVSMLKEAHKIMGMASSLGEELNQIFNKMTKVKITDLQLLQYIEDIFPASRKEAEEEVKLAARTSNIREAVLEYTHNGPGQDMTGFRGTLWNAYNGVTGYFQNVKEFKSLDAKMESNVMGGLNAKKMQTALDLALELIK